MICKKSLLFHYTTLLIICQVIVSFLLVPVASASDTSNFYFSDFTADYYLKKDENGISHLAVKETVTAEFPPYKQNKGLVRKIPYTNNNGQNLTLEKLDKSNIVVTRNGQLEPIYSIEKDSEENAFYVSTGTDDYVIGTQVYTFEYTFDKVITDFSDFQELYWDTNGNDSYQPFESVTAILHLDPEDYSKIIPSSTSCYVGYYSENNTDRCTITENQTDFTITFNSTNLSKMEGLTFAIDFNANTFVVPGPELNITAILLIFAQGACIILAIYLTKKAYDKNRDTLRAFSHTFIKPEYQVDKNITVAEAAAIWLGNTTSKQILTATITELAVRGKIKLVSLDSKKKWQIITGDLTGLEKHEVAAIQLLIGKAKTAAELSNQTFETTKRTSLTSAYTTFTTHPNELGKKHNFINRTPTTFLSAPVLIIFSSITAFVLSAAMPEYLVPNPETMLSITFVTGVISLIPLIIIHNKFSKICHLNIAGVKKSKFYDGLKQYINLAEKDRIAFLQSVKGADTSASGIVKLYEKLLPYAIIFGLENSWLKALEIHYQELNSNPSWIAGDAVSVAGLSSAFSGLSSVASSNFSASMPSTGGSGSSGSSGGGGGGFSGGGGGGGGFGGR